MAGSGKSASRAPCRPGASDAPCNGDRSTSSFESFDHDSFATGTWPAMPSARRPQPTVIFASTFEHPAQADPGPAGSGQQRPGVRPAPGSLTIAHLHHRTSVHPLPRFRPWRPDQHRGRRLREDPRPDLRRPDDWTSKLATNPAGSPRTSGCGWATGPTSRSLMVPSPASTGPRPPLWPTATDPLRVDEIRHVRPAREPRAAARGARVDRPRSRARRYCVKNPLLARRAGVGPG